jgi:hypothetical protein
MPITTFPFVRSDTAGPDHPNLITGPGAYETASGEVALILKAGRVLQKFGQTWLGRIERNNPQDDRYPYTMAVWLSNGAVRLTIPPVGDPPTEQDCLVKKGTTQ